MKFIVPSHFAIFFFFSNKHYDTRSLESDSLFFIVPNIFHYGWDKALMMVVVMNILQHVQIQECLQKKKKKKNQC